ncbi:peptidoglycan DD-metalloendopeptidase family protein [Synechococcus sp. A10-1-5-1]|uniref:M23 family metallopeptidase n=1 Tax=Synechococcus sp. A10-1-5-1 TaxID=2936507 RepID=UPI00200178FD|nr:M23 family metallopeptidase [Synechococcus sp. A10-1-5-1]UPM50501.1 peptidoglycan DD-metalloendopeptidase family protein [Synechococcus sp. A10-1-5-1]
MKPVHFLLTTAASTAALGAAGSVVAPSLADSKSASLPQLSAPPAISADLIAAADSKPSTEKIWVKARQAITLKHLARQLEQEESLLSSLNDVKADHVFSRSEWLVLPSGSIKRVKQVAAVDTSELRRTPPLEAPPEPSDTARIRRGDNTLAKVAQRYNLSIQKLLKLNPGLRGAQLVVGTPIRVAQANAARSRMVLGLKPVGSGGLSWPDQPDFGFGAGENLNDRAWVWPTKGIFTSGYGWRWGRMHRGIDIANNIGTPIVAAKSGQVVSAGWHGGGYGYLVELRHTDGTVTRYGHNSRILVRAGESVAQGKVISLMGSTGRSTGPHLHFEIIPAGRGAVNPLQLLPPRA